MKRSAGVTLIELIIVMVLMGVLAVYATNQFERATFDSEVYARELQTALRHAQELAMTHTGSFGYRVAVNASGFTVVRNDGTAITDPFTGATPYAAAWPDAVVNPVPVVSFDGRGVPSWNGTINITVSSTTRSVVVEATGYVH